CLRVQERSMRKQRTPETPEIYFSTYDQLHLIKLHRTQANHLLVAARAAVARLFHPPVWTILFRWSEGVNTFVNDRKPPHGTQPERRCDVVESRVGALPKFFDLAEPSVQNGARVYAWT